MDFATFFAQYGLFVILAVLLVFMILNTRRRTAKMKLEQEQKQRDTVPGARVLLQGGLYGTIVEFDSEDLDKPARVEIAPGTVIDVHSQAVLRIVDTSAVVDDVTPLDDQPAADAPSIESAEETRARLERDADDQK